MGSNVSRTVEIRISNKTQITLNNPRTYFYSGHSILSGQPSVPPGSSETFMFSNTTRFSGCNGVLAFEAKSFTLAIYFSNPIDYNLFSVEMGLELSLDKVHRGKLVEVYNRLLRISRNSNNSGNNFMFPTVILKESQERAQLTAGPVKVTATISRDRNAVIRVEVEEQKSSGKEAKMETSH